MPPSGEVAGLRVFIHSPHGGNPVPLVADARHMDDEQMRSVAQRYGHESAFLLPASDARADWRLRFFVPRHEMEMCGHATVGALWGLRQWGIWTQPTAVVETLSGLVQVEWDGASGRAWVSQPAPTVRHLQDHERTCVARALGWRESRMPPLVVNSCTSRTKTLVNVGSVEELQMLRPDCQLVEAACKAIDSTGLYPYAVDDRAADGVVFARQFPRSSGYPEDAATGIAAAALWGFLHQSGRIAVGRADAPAAAFLVRQGDAMGKPSAIEIRPRRSEDGRVVGCWLSGRVAFAAL
ncbi:Phenazine biosynthesis PhzC/PhzF protein [Variovorax sp. WDL1]|nr:Phenazine biosynthesis PhzC/PhzF protein [Variovorax sp. WDL1]